MEQNLEIRSLQDLERLAQALAQQLNIGDVVALRGNLGAGKTTFSKYLIHELCPKNTLEQITSPTFNLVHTYEGRKPVWHFDLYRLDKREDVFELGIDDAFLYGISIIEWPQIAHDLLPKATIWLDIDFTNDENSRIISVQNHKAKIIL
jgi:tRNA threonylcarbamoyl adenosine modification protein YjeE